MFAFTLCALNMAAASIIHAAPSGLGGSFEKTGIGFSTLGVPGDGGSLSGWLQFSERHSLQVIAAIGSTGPVFEFETGGLYRYTLTGNQATGFHVGGGVLLGTFGTLNATGGTESAFFIGFGPLAGIHFQIPGLNSIGLSLDGGANFLIADGELNFSIKNLTSALGLSVHYFF